MCVLTYGEKPVIDNEEIEKEISERVGYVLNKLDHDPMSSSTTPFGSPGGSNSTNPYANITFDDDNSHQQIKEENARFAQLSIKFYDRKRVKRPSWFGKLEEDVQWETWLINVTLIPQQSKDQDQRQQFYNQLNGQVENLIFEISNKVDSHKDHIPVITSAELMPFGYTIQLVGNQGWTGFIKKLLE